MVKSFNDSQLMAILQEHQVLSLVGFCKNAGKTTVLNAFLRAARKSGENLVFGLVSIGLDGESVDRAGSKYKPPILVTPGTLFITQSSLWSQCEVTKELVEILGPGGALGSFLLVRAQSAGYIQLSGPASRQQMEGAIEALISFGAQRILIDGSINRRVMDWQENQALVLATAGFCFKNEENALEETLFLYNLLGNLPLKKNLSISSHGAFLQGEKIIREFSLEEAHKEGIPWADFKSEKCDALYLNGAITHNLISAFNQHKNTDEGFNLIVPNGSKIMLNIKEWENWQNRGLKVYTLNNFTLAGIFVNQQNEYGFLNKEGQFFMRLCLQAKCPVFDVEEGLACNIPV